MEEILPGLWSWKGTWERDYAPFTLTVTSYYWAGSKTLIDPIAPAEGLGWFAENRPENIVLTTADHCRHAPQFVEEFGCQLYSPVKGKLPRKELNPRLYKAGDTVVPGITAYSCPGLAGPSVVLHINTPGGVLAMGDVLVRFPDDGTPMLIPKEVLLMVPDEVIKANLKPIQRLAWSVLPKSAKVKVITKRSEKGHKATRAALKDVVGNVEFDTVLFTHGNPISPGGKAALEEFLAK